MVSRGARSRTSSARRPTPAGPGTSPPCTTSPPGSTVRPGLSARWARYEKRNNFALDHSARIVIGYFPQSIFCARRVAPVGHNGAKAAARGPIVPAVIGCVSPMGAAGLRPLSLPASLGRGGVSFTRRATTFRLDGAEPPARSAARGFPRGMAGRCGRPSLRQSYWDKRGAADRSARACAAIERSDAAGVACQEHPRTPVRHLKPET